MKNADFFRNQLERHWTIDLEQLGALADFADGDGENEMDLLVAVVGAYLEASPKLVAAMQTAVTEGNLERIAAYSHRMKSSAWNVGATRFSQLCSEIEKSARDNNLSRVREQMTGFEDLYHAGHEDLELVLGLTEKPLRILMVEDDMTLQPIWKSLFSQIFPKHQLDWVISGSEAVNRIDQRSSAGAPYDLILADVFLAGAQTGLDIFDHIHRRNTPAPELILVSGVDRSKLMDHLREYAQPPQLISKPLNPQECERVLRQALLHIQPT